MLVVEGVERRDRDLAPVFPEAVGPSQVQQDITPHSGIGCGDTTWKCGKGREGRIQWVGGGSIIVEGRLPIESILEVRAQPRIGLVSGAAALRQGALRDRLSDVLKRIVGKAGEPACR